MHAPSIKARYLEKLTTGTKFSNSTPSEINATQKSLWLGYALYGTADFELLRFLGSGSPDLEGKLSVWHVCEFKTDQRGWDG